MRMTAQPIEVAVVVQRAAWAGIAEELAIGEAAPLRHKHVFATQRFAAGAGKAEDLPIVDNLECGDRQKKAATRKPAGFVGRLGVRSKAADGAQGGSQVQLGPRISEAQYRQLKLAAMLRGVTVQTLVESAIAELLTNHPESLHGSLAASEHLEKSRSLKPC
jgi:hypothetical protein